MRRTIRTAFRQAASAPLVFLDHHESHAASAFFPSPFEEAAILTLDGVGEWSTATLRRGQRQQDRADAPTAVSRIRSGLLYSAFTYYCGFKVNSGEYKLMGLAPYGRPVYEDMIYEHLIDLKPDGSLWLDMEYFNYCQGLTMTEAAVRRAVRRPAAQAGSALEQRHMDLAASIQRVTEECVLRMGRDLHQRTGMKNLVWPAASRSNCVANGRLLREGLREHLDPAGRRRRRRRARRRAVRLAPAAGQAAARPTATTAEGQPARARSIRRARSSEFLRRSRAPLRRSSSDEASCWITSPTRWPRARGRRLVSRPRGVRPARAGRAQHPRRRALAARCRRRMNLKIKFRESFRPFAPVRAARARPRVVRDAARTKTRPTCSWSRRSSSSRRLPLSPRRRGSCCARSGSRRGA